MYATFKQAAKDDEVWVREQAEKLFDPPIPGTTLDYAFRQGKVYVLTDAGERIGFTVFGPAIGRTMLRVLALAVLPEYQEVGWGLRLAMEGCATARSHGFEILTWEVAEGNAPARGLYRRLGAVETGRRPNYYTRADGTFEDALVMSLAL